MLSHNSRRQQVVSMEDDTPEATSRTVFVRGISFSSGKDEVEKAFEAVGPIRKCFLVQAKGDAKHKGYGYVQFALREDAAAAVRQLHSSSLGGRKLKVCAWLATADLCSM
jgi:nucleolar protein 4